MPRIPREIARHSVPREKLTSDLEKSFSRLVSEKVEKEVSAAASSYFEIEILSDGVTELALSIEAQTYFSTDARRELAVLLFCGCLEIYQPVFEFNTDGDKIIFDDVAAGFILETTDTLMIRSL